MTTRSRNCEYSNCHEKATTFCYAGGHAVRQYACGETHAAALIAARAPWVKN